MQRRNTTLLALAALLLLAAALPWWFGDSEAVIAPKSNEAPPVVLVAPSDPTSHEPLRELPAGAPRVVVEVTLVEAYVPPPPLRAKAVSMANREVLPTRLVAGTGAGPFAEDERAGLALAAIDLGPGRTLLRQVAITPNAVAEIPIGGPLVVRGQVNSKDRPVPGARVSLGELDPMGNLREAVTGEDGRFELDTPASEGVPLLVQADGFAWLWRPIRVAADAALEQVVTLVPGGEIHVQLAAKAERLDLARVFVVPPETVSGELSQYPFFLQAMSGGAPVDAEGRAQLSGLPGRGPVGLVVLHPCAVFPACWRLPLGSGRGWCRGSRRVKRAVAGTLMERAVRLVTSRSGRKSAKQTPFAGCCGSA